MCQGDPVCMWGQGGREKGRKGGSGRKRNRDRHAERKKERGNRHHFQLLFEIQEVGQDCPPG